ncbi:MAG: DUF983 domain-containing protein [Saprospiraceae bacterium]
MFALRCPRCRQGRLFPTASYSASRPFEMHDKCPLCGQDYVIEPGFYYGAMFISYIFTALFCIFFMAVVHWWIGISTNWSFVMLLAILGINFIYIFRLARSLWIHVNVKYSDNIAQQVADGKRAAK